MSILFEKHDEYPESILIRNFFGIICVEDIIESWDYLIESKLFHDKIIGVINNLSKAELNLSWDNFERLITYLKSKQCFKNIKLAVVTDSPEQIVFPFLGKEREIDLKISPFSTVEAAT